MSQMTLESRTIFTVLSLSGQNIILPDNHVTQQLQGQHLSRWEKMKVGLIWGLFVDLQHPAISIAFDSGQKLYSILPNKINEKILIF
jgi:hypothetical protein